MFMAKEGKAVEEADPSPLKLVGGALLDFDTQPEAEVSNVMVQKAVKEEKPKCGYCQGDHKLYHCKAFRPLKPKQKLQFIQAKKYCEICFNKHAEGVKCPFKNGKVCRYCKTHDHHSELHVEEDDVDEGGKTPPVKKSPGKKKGRGNGVTFSTSPKIINKSPGRRSPG